MAFVYPAAATGPRTPHRRTLTARWISQRMARVLDVDYFHVVFTLPSRPTSSNHMSPVSKAVTVLSVVGTRVTPPPWKDSREVTVTRHGERFALPVVELDWSKSSKR